MKKPEKKEYTKGEHDLIRLPKEGYNQACNDWEAYIKEHYIARDKLLSVVEIQNVMAKVEQDNRGCHHLLRYTGLAKTIHKAQGEK